MAKCKSDSIFLDVFRRADKNDDGALSWDEFKNFFADGVLSEDELKKLFNEIDTHKTNNIDTGELCAYFSKQMGSFQHVFPAIEVLNTAVTTALASCHQEYSGKPLYEQFCTRFLLREVATQLAALESPMETAAEALEREATANREDCSPVTVDESTSFQHSSDTSATKVGGVIPGRYARRAKQQQLSTQTSFTDGVPNSLNKQMERLQLLVDKLENKVVLNPVEEEVTSAGEPMNLIVHRRFVCNPGADRAFRNSLRSYVEGATRDQHCQHVNVRSQTGSNMYNVYEIWSSENDWKSHVKCDVSKQFQHANIDNLELPEVTRTLVIPGKWCATN